MRTIQQNREQRHHERKRKKYLWMQIYMPEALDMMKEGIRIGLTFKEPTKLKRGVKHGE